MFAYCGNNPVIHLDYSGESSTVCITDDPYSFALPTAEPGSGGGNISSAVATVTILAVAYYSVNKANEERAFAEVVSAKNPSSQDIYSVYFLYEIDGDPNVIVYVGRVKTTNFDTRMAYHAKKNRALAGVIHELSYGACRAIEQAGMIMLHTLNPGNALNNQIRGISPTNKNRYIYLAEAFDLINSNLYPEFSILPASYWFNFAENEYLNMGL